MLTLTTLDGISLTDEGRLVSAVQNRRQSMGLLLLLAASGSRGISRERAMDLFWPDGEVRDPRHSLDQLLSVTRALAGAPLIERAGTLRLDRAQLRVDLDHFEQAVRARRFEEAVAIHRSPFAEGFRAPSVALSHFLEAQRERVSGTHANALRSLAEAAESRGDMATAILWWTDLLTARQLDSSVAVRLVAALAAEGRTVDALRTARGAAALARAEFGSDDEELGRWIHRLTTGRSGVPMSALGTLSPAAAVPGAEPDKAHPEPALFGGRYHVEYVLRRGRVTTTYLARDATPAYGTVEVHLLADAVAAVAPAARFLEVFARVIRLAHPRILPTLDARAEGRQRWFVTAIRPERTLEHLLENDGALPIPDVLRMSRELADALAHAHGRGVLHGDIRPRHVSFGGGGTCLSGFGVAESATGVASAASDSAVLTVGSVHYQSPEQILGEVRVDMRSDVYSLGCILHHALVGHVPFGSEGGPGRVRKLTQAAPPVRELRETVPEALAAVVSTCLARIPADRYPDAMAVAEALGYAQEVTM